MKSVFDPQETKKSLEETACCYRILERSWEWNEVEIGKLPINTNHRTIQYPCEILWQEGRRRSTGLETRWLKVRQAWLVFTRSKEIEFKRFPFYTSFDTSVSL